MEVVNNLLTIFVVLVGLSLCRLEESEKLADSIDMLWWCHSPLINILYGLIQLIGVVFVIGFVIYLICVHWWYILVVVGASLLAGIGHIVSLLIFLPIMLIWKHFDWGEYWELRARRFIGTLMIIAGVVLCFVL